jgi:peptidoglycan/LPS O-acetylase OafA/YrhL
MATERFVRVVLVAGAAFFLVVGAWAFIDPASFYDELAEYPPYNRHFLHDVGAFQLGIGASLALAFVGWEGRRVALWGAAVASGFHAASHFIDTELGGRDSDPWLLSLLTVVLVAAAILSRRAPEPGKL